MGAPVVPTKAGLRAPWLFDHDWNRLPTIFDLDGNLVAIVEKGRPERIQNATMLTAAPLLYVALKGLLEWVEDPEARATTSAPFDAAQRAIAAAEGSAP